MRIIISEDSVLLREGIARLIEHNGDEVVASFDSAEGVKEAVAQLNPDLVILDVRMPPTFKDEGIKLALDLRAENSSLPILVLSQYVEERYASELLTSDGGGIGYLLKDRVADVKEFLRTLSEVANGATVFDPEVVSQLLMRRRDDARLQQLTDRERQVLAAIAEGRSNQEIAGLLFLSEASIEKHISAIFQKLGLTRDEKGNRRVLAALAHIKSVDS